MSDNIIEYENLYHKIFFTIIKNTQPGIFATTNETITDESITDETKYYENFINSIKENHPDIFNSTTETITNGIRDIAWTLQLSNNINKKYSALDNNTSLIVSDLTAFKNEKKFTDDELTRFIFVLKELINDARLPKRTDEEAEVWLAEQAAKDEVKDEKEYKRWVEEQAAAMAARAAAEKAEEAEEIKRQARKADANEWANMMRNQNWEIEEWWRREQQKNKEKALLKRDMEYATLHQIAQQRERERLAASRKKRASESEFRKSLLFARRGGSRRRKRKATRKLRKHYKSRKSYHKHIRRKK